MSVAIVTIILAILALIGGFAQAGRYQELYFMHYFGHLVGCMDGDYLSCRLWDI